MEAWLWWGVSLSWFCVDRRYPLSFPSFLWYKVDVTWSFRVNGILIWYSIQETNAMPAAFLLRVLLCYHLLLLACFGGSLMNYKNWDKKTSSIYFLYSKHNSTDRNQSTRKLSPHTQESKGTVDCFWFRLPFEICLNNTFQYENNFIY